MWPFSTLGWPDETPELEKYYPTDVLVTGFDIIFFWVARMMMMGVHFMDEVPFHTVYIHALVRDEKGQKMSKSKGNVIDPLDLIGEYGADAMRMTLAAFAAQGRDIKLSTERVEGYRNFATKLWNAARFCEHYECRPDPGFDPASCTQTVNRWIVGKVAQAAEDVTRGLDEYKFNEAAGAIYSFTWGTFCDWYLEFAKPVLQEGGEAAAETRKTAAWALDQLLHILHPFMPFITEELWDRLGDDRPSMLIDRSWPRYDGLTDADADADMDWVVRAISQIRSVRAEMNVPPKAEIPLVIRGGDDPAKGCVETHGALLARLARLSAISFSDADVQPGSVQIILDETTLVLPLADVIDIEAEKARLRREIAKLDDETGKFDKKLANEGFLAKAPPEVVEEQKERRAEAALKRDKIAEALERLSGA